MENALQQRTRITRDSLKKREKTGQQHTTHVVIFILYSGALPKETFPDVAKRDYYKKIYMTHKIPYV